MGNCDGGVEISEVGLFGFEVGKVIPFCLLTQHKL